jgi:hypothetical protein
MSRAHRARRGFSLVDILVSIAVMATLIGILLPSVSRVQESARRVICQSNLKQIGLGITMYADDNRGLIPASAYGDNENYEQRPTEMMQLHLGHGIPGNWEGLGWLIESGHITAEGVFYCPSHHGNHAHDEYEDAWRNLGDEIVGNFNYRPVSDFERDLARLNPATVLATDGLRTTMDYNHLSGNNVLAADMSVVWYHDENGQLLSLLPDTDDGVFGGDYGAAVVWQILDDGGPRPGQFDGPNGRDDNPNPTRTGQPSIVHGR